MCVCVCVTHCDYRMRLKLIFMCGLWSHLTNVYKPAVTKIFHLVYYIQMVMAPWPAMLRKMLKLNPEWYDH